LLPKLAGTTPPTARERAALEFAERFATAHTAIDEAFMQRLRAVFADDELVELGLVTGAFVMLGRLHRTFGVSPMTAASHAVLRPEGA
jgi:alkylhydroperoxidase family enzyme